MTGVAHLTGSGERRTEVTVRIVLHDGTIAEESRYVSSFDAILYTAAELATKMATDLAGD